MNESIRTLLAAAIDYAGLFPPAGLSMPAAVEHYARYRLGPDRWALGRFVLPVSGLDEFEEAAAVLSAERDGGAWPLAALTTVARLPGDAERVRRFNAAHRGRGASAAVIDVLEFPAPDAETVRAAAPILPPGLTAYVELPPEGPLASSVAALRDSGLRAKVRTGGVTGGAFPAPAALARFIRACTRAGVAFKATAGLHHPLRASYRLTYDANSAEATMFGYLNVFLAAAFARAGADEATLAALLDEGSPNEFHFTDEGAAWRDRHASTADLRLAREGGAVSFGSCSFTEPLADLVALQLA